MKITVGITTYNRFNYLVQMRDSLYASNGLGRCNIRVYDDSSTTLGIETLRNLFPDAKQIIVRPVNLGPCGNMRQMYLDFLNTGDELLVAADADLLFHPDWIEFMLKYLPFTDGILSLYNSILHKPKKELTIEQEQFLEKRHLGSAGVVMRRDIVKEIVENVPACKGYDWAWSAYLRNTGKRLMGSKLSYVQHIGLYGHNCDGFKTLEFGLNFYPKHAINERYLVNFFQESLLQVTRQIKEETIDAKPLNKLLKKSKRLKRKIKKLLNTPFRQWAIFNFSLGQNTSLAKVSSVKRKQKI